MALVVERTLVCPACGDVIGYARYRRWPGNLAITAVAGHPLNPVAAGVLRRIAERELADATGAVGRDQAQDFIDFIDKHSTELIYDLTCPRGHPILRTAPQITRAMTRSGGGWTDLT
jgi:hypothetical protein